MDIEDITKNIEMIVLILLFILISVLKLVEVYLKKTKKINNEQLESLSEEIFNLKEILNTAKQ